MYPTRIFELGLDHAFHHDLSSSIPDRNRNAFLVHIHADIFSADHKGAPPLERLSEALKPYSTRGALLYCVGLPVEFVLDLSDQPQPHRASGQTYSGAKSFSKNSFDSLAPSSDNHTDLFFVAGSEM